MAENIISGKTRLCALIGDPVEHSMSPVMQNAAFREKGLDYVYVALRVKGEDLPKAVNGIRSLNIVGVNVTIPHKVAVIPFLDELDTLAEKIGAVNTIVNESGKLKGYNTDASGFLRPLLEKGIELAGKRVAILGAGGAVRAISFALADRGADLTILNRTVDRVKEVVSRLARSFDRNFKAMELNRENLKKVLNQADILVNATSIGMSPNIGETPVEATLLQSMLIVYDIVYNPVKTRLLKEAELAGAETLGGLDMLVWQGALAFEKWTGQEAPVEIMKREALKLLGNEEHR